jgi:hypothetical protein
VTDRKSGQSIPEVLERRKASFPLIGVIYIPATNSSLEPVETDPLASNRAGPLFVGPAAQGPVKCLQRVLGSLELENAGNGRE